MSFPVESPESTEYGFGVQFQQHQNQFYQIQQQSSIANSHPYSHEHPEILQQSLAAASSPHHLNQYHMHQQYPPQQSQQQATAPRSSLSDASLGTVNNLQPTGNYLSYYSKHALLNVKHNTTHFGEEISSKALVYENLFSRDIFEQPKPAIQYQPRYQ